jgi:nicotinamidase-related amidase
MVDGGTSDCERFEASEVVRGAGGFLTERDRRVLANSRWAKAESFGLGTSPTVVVVDAYYAALGVPRMPVEEAVRTWPAACGTVGWEAIDQTVTLLEAARIDSVSIVYAKGFPSAPNPWNKKPAAASFVDSSGSDPNEIVAELAPHPGDLVVEKAAPSVFDGTPLDTILRARGCDTLIICGEATSGCVRASVVDGRVLGYAVAVVEECCFDRFESSHWVSLFDMDQKYCDVMRLSQVMKYMESLGAC